MYHVELRQFPHNFTRFNLAEADLSQIVEPWVREKVLDFGERRWSPHEARLTILEGPELSLRELTMGRGWRAAQRASEDVTDRVLAAAAQAAENAAARATQDAPQQAAGPAGLLSDPLALGVQIASLLGSDPTGLLEAWRATAAFSPELSPSQALARAEETIAARDTNAG
jgi:hypothetical protein